MRSLKKLSSDYTNGALTAASKQTWLSIQSRLTLYLGFLIALTFLFVIVVYALPIARGAHEGTQIFPNSRNLNFAILATHVATAIPPLLIGLFAFSKRARRISMKAHRWFGTVYCVAIWISAITGVILALGNTMGLASRIGFSLLGVLWFSTTFFAYSYARKKDIVNHRIWMIRSFALTLAVVTIRPIMMMPLVVDVDISLLNNVGSWACWVPNLMIAEMYIRRTNHRGILAPPINKNLRASIGGTQAH